MGAPFRFLLAAALLTSLAVLVAACPDEQVPIELTEQGIEILYNACIYCEPPKEGESDNCCRFNADSPPWWGSEGSYKVSIRLLLIEVPEGTSDLQSAELKDHSACFTMGFSCKKKEWACFASALNDELDKHLGSGLGFDGLKDPSGGLLLMTFHASETSCTASSLFGCAGLSFPANTESYDITCASCNGGKRLGGNLSLPCPSSCFARQCRTYISEHAEIDR